MIVELYTPDDWEYCRYKIDTVGKKFKKPFGNWQNFWNETPNEYLVKAINSEFYHKFLVYKERNVHKTKF